MATQISGLTKPKFNLEQARKVLGTVALLSTEQHKYSKICYYPDSIWLESANGFSRSLSNLTEYVWSTQANRKIENLPLYIAAATECITEEVKKNDSSDAPWYTKSGQIQEEIDRIINAQAGLEAHQNNQYKDLPDHCAQIEIAVKTLKSTRDLFQETKQKLRPSPQGHRLSDQLAESEKKNAELQKELDVANGLIRSLLINQNNIIVNAQKGLENPATPEMILLNIQRLSAALAIETSRLQVALAQPGK